MCQPVAPSGLDRPRSARSGSRRSASVARTWRVCSPGVASHRQDHCRQVSTETVGGQRRLPATGRRRPVPRPCGCPGAGPRPPRPPRPDRRSAGCAGPGRVDPRLRLDRALLPTSPRGTQYASKSAKRGQLQLGHPLAWPRRSRRGPAPPSGPGSRARPAAARRSCRPRAARPGRPAAPRSACRRSSRRPSGRPPGRRRPPAASSSRSASGTPSQRALPIRSPPTSLETQARVMYRSIIGRASRSAKSASIGLRDPAVDAQRPVVRVDLRARPGRCRSGRSRSSASRTARAGPATGRRRPAPPARRPTGLGSATRRRAADTPCRSASQCPPSPTTAADRPAAAPTPAGSAADPPVGRLAGRPSPPAPPPAAGPAGGRLRAAGGDRPELGRAVRPGAATAPRAEPRRPATAARDGRPAPGRVSAAATPTAPNSADAGQPDPAAGARPARRAARRTPASSTAVPTSRAILSCVPKSVDGELLDRLGHRVDHDAADRDQRRGPGAGEDRHQFGHAERHGGGGDPGQRGVPRRRRSRRPSAPVVVTITEPAPVSRRSDRSRKPDDRVSGTPAGVTPCGP